MLVTPEQYRDDAILDAQRAQEAQGEESAYVGMVWLGDGPSRPCCGVPVVLPHEAGCPVVEPACSTCGEPIVYVADVNAGYWQHLETRSERCGDGVGWAVPSRDHWKGGAA